MKRFLSVAVLLLSVLCLSVAVGEPAYAAMAAWESAPAMVADPALSSDVTPLFEGILNPAAITSLLFLFGTVANAPKKRDAKPAEEKPRAKLKPEPMDTGNIPIPQRADMVMPGLGEAVERHGDIVVPVEKPLHKDYVSELAFNEEPMVIIIPRGSEKDQTMCTDLIEINGIKAEVLFKNGWVQMGWLPKGFAFTTKRKYVEVLARSKQDNVTTSVIQKEGEDPQNVVQRFTAAKTSFQVLRDDNPKGKEWLQRLVSSQL